MPRRQVYALKLHEVWWRLLFSKQRTSFSGRLISPNVDTRSVRHSGLALNKHVWCQGNESWSQEWLNFAVRRSLCGLARDSALCYLLLRDMFLSRPEELLFHLFDLPPLLKITASFQPFARGSMPHLTEKDPCFIGLMFAGVAARSVAAVHT